MIDMNEKLLNLPVLLQGLRAQGLDAAVVASPENFFYLGSVKIQTQTLIRDRMALGIVTADGAITLVVCATEVAQTRRYSWVEDIRSYQEFVQTPMSVVAEVLEEKGLSRARLGIEERYVAAHHHRDLATRVPKATLTSCDESFERARMIKTEPEIARMRVAAKGTDEAILRALQAARPGVAEHTLARMMSDALFDIGHGTFRDITWGVAVGANILTTHYWAEESVLMPGEMVRINLRSACRGYFSHLYRRAVVGSASERQRSWYERAREVHVRCIDRLRPGARACDLFHAAREDMSRLKVDAHGSHVGHSTGIALHEGLRLQPLDDTPLQAGMVIASEPMMMDPGVSIYHLEDLVLVTDGYPVLLSDRTPTETIFEIR